MERHDTGFWRKRIAEQGLCGQTIAEYCRGQGLSRWTFMRWRKRLAEDCTAQPLVEIRKSFPLKKSEPEGQVFAVHLANGVQIRFNETPEPGMIGEIVAAVRAAT